MNTIHCRFIVEVGRTYPLLHRLCIPVFIHSARKSTKITALKSVVNCRKFNIYHIIWYTHVYFWDKIIVGDVMLIKLNNVTTKLILQKIEHSWSMNHGYWRWYLCWWIEMSLVWRWNWWRRNWWQNWLFLSPKFTSFEVKIWHYVKTKSSVCSNEGVIKFLRNVGIFSFTNRFMLEI